MYAYFLYHHQDFSLKQFLFILFGFFFTSIDCHSVALSCPVSLPQLTFAVWKELCDRKIVELWEVYQAGPSLPYRSARVGFWTVPGSWSAESELCQEDPADGVAEKHVLDDGGEEAGAGGAEEEEVERFFPSDNIASRRRNLTGLHIRCLTESVSVTRKA